MLHVEFVLQGEVKASMGPVVMEHNEDYDKDGKVDAALGGPYTLKGDKYEETPEYGIGDVLELLKGKPQSFECKVEANKLHQNGKLSSGLTIEEVWERVEKK
jgi:hypothetical protein